MALRRKFRHGLPSQIHNLVPKNIENYAVNHELHDEVKNAISIFCGVRLVYACTVTYCAIVWSLCWPIPCWYSKSNPFTLLSGYSIGISDNHCCHGDDSDGRHVCLKVPLPTPNKLSPHRSCVQSLFVCKQ